MKPAHDDWNWARDKRKQPSTQDELDAVTQCKLFCAWKGGGPCLRSDCPRRPTVTVTGEPICPECAEEWP